MALYRPVLETIEPFDASVGYTFKFNFYGSWIGGHNTLVLSTNESGTSTVVYNQNDSSAYYYRQHIVGSSSGLQNGHYYKAQVFVYNSLGILVGQSAEVPFWCMSAPTFSVSGISSGQVTTTNPTFTVAYSHSGSEPLNYAQLTVYSSNGTSVFAQSPYLYVSSYGTSISYRFSGLTNGSSYYLKATGVTTHGMELNTSLQRFTVNVPSLTATISVSPTSAPNDGGIRIRGSFYSSSITGIGISRREYGGSQWIRVAYISGTSGNVDVVDRTVQNGKSYQYAGVPMVNDIEGQYVINSNYVTAAFNGLWLVDCDGNYAGTALDTSLGEVQLNHSTTVLETLNSEYPFVVHSSVSKYRSGSASGTFIELTSSDEAKERNWSYADSILEFLANKKPKILKDESGAIYLVMITDTPTVSNSEHRDKTTIGFSWVEIGDVNNPSDLQNNQFGVV